MKRNWMNIDTVVVSKLLCRFLAEEVTKAGFNRIVIGLSGGIDSALSCCIAAEALGGDNVRAIRMPYRTSSPESLSHAQLLIDQLGIASETVPITPMVEPLLEITPGIDNNRRGNIMARMRMTILFDRSAGHNSLVIGTSNKTELLLGYGTIFGDLASAINPLGDLYKTQVRQLARHFNVPQVIIDKSPTADLIPNQTDEGDFGFTYAEVDKLLYLLVDERYSPAEAVAAGFEREFVDNVLRMMHRSHFKRTLPIIPKVSGRTVNHDFRYLRDAGL